ncbi:Protein kinase, catalytic domain-containing protein [Rozella allomycis CSF55]|uniref:Protein kinase, catalytic domain-containing protein n=1 Tax=Rozella allomycis (strain CSF55) TaxID=988480 RepID=A0A075AXP8_ROZAC|nr:Protein kinase, catalytic domain-containing protein [Rozella allomycis CSF55]|eukprot:EPZ34924.1 Protein kinase, catalytic domain-containing protein [Rozella allomycis CSF55]
MITFLAFTFILVSKVLSQCTTTVNSFNSLPFSPNQLGGISGATSDLSASFETSEKALLIIGYSGTYNIRLADYGCVNLSGYSSIRMQLFLPTSSSTFRISLVSGTTQCGSSTSKTVTVFSTGIVDTSYTQQWQTINIPLSSYTAYGSDLTKGYAIYLSNFNSPYSQFLFKNVEFYSSSSCSIVNQSPLPVYCDLLINSFSSQPFSPNQLGGTTAATGNLIATFESTQNAVQIIGNTGTYYMKFASSGCLNLNSYVSVRISVYIPASTSQFNIALYSGNSDCSSWVSKGWVPSSNYIVTSLAQQWQQIDIPISDFGVDVTKALMIEFNSFSDQYSQFLFKNVLLHSTNTCNIVATSKLSTTTTKTTASIRTTTTNLITTSSTRTTTTATPVITTTTTTPLITTTTTTTPLIITTTTITSLITSTTTTTPLTTTTTTTTPLITTTSTTTPLITTTTTTTPVTTITTATTPVTTTTTTTPVITTTDTTTPVTTTTTTTPSFTTTTTTTTPSVTATTITTPVTTTTPLITTTNTTTLAITTTTLIATITTTTTLITTTTSTTTPVIRTTISTTTPEITTTTITTFVTTTTSTTPITTTTTATPTTTTTTPVTTIVATISTATLTTIIQPEITSFTISTLYRSVSSTSYSRGSIIDPSFSAIVSAPSSLTYLPYSASLSSQVAQKSSFVSTGDSTKALTSTVSAIYEAGSQGDMDSSTNLIVLVSTGCTVFVLSLSAAIAVFVKRRKIKKKRMLMNELRRINSGRLNTSGNRLILSHANLKSDLNKKSQLSSKFFMNVHFIGVEPENESKYKHVLETFENRGNYVVVGEKFLNNEILRGEKDYSEETGSELLASVEKDIDQTHHTQVSFKECGSQVSADEELDQRLLDILKKEGSYDERLTWRETLGEAIKGDFVNVEQFNIDERTLAVFKSDEFKYKFWLEIKAKREGRTLSKQSMIIEESRKKIDKLYNEVVDFHLPPGITLKNGIDILFSLLERLAEVENSYPSLRMFLRENPKFQNEAFKENYENLTKWFNISFLIYQFRSIIRDWMSSNFPVNEFSITETITNNKRHIEKILRTQDIEKIFNMNLIKQVNTLIKKGKEVLNHESFYERVGLPTIRMVLNDITLFPGYLKYECMQIRLEKVPSLKVNEESQQQSDAIIKDMITVLKLGTKVKRNIMSLNCCDLRSIKVFMDKYDKMMIKFLKYYLTLSEIRYLSSEYFFDWENDWAFLISIMDGIPESEELISIFFCHLLSKLLDKLEGKIGDVLRHEGVRGKLLMRALESMRLRIKSYISLTRLLTHSLEDASDLKIADMNKLVKMLYENDFSIVKFSECDLKTPMEKKLYVFCPPYMMQSQLCCVLKGGLCESVEQTFSENAPPFVVVFWGPCLIDWMGPQLHLDFDCCLYFQDIPKDSLRLLGLGKNNCNVARKSVLNLFREVLNVDVECVYQSRHSRINQSLAQLHSKVLSFCSSLIASADVIRKESKEELLNFTLEEMESFFNLIATVSYRFMKYMRYENKKELIVKIIHFSIDWVSFTCSDCSPTDIRTFRWAVTALRFAFQCLKGNNIFKISDHEFLNLKNKVSCCMSLLISHFQREQEESLYGINETQNEFIYSPSIYIRSKTPISRENKKIDYLTAINTLDCNIRNRLAEKGLVGRVLNKEIQIPIFESEIIFSPTALAKGRERFRYQIRNCIGTGSFGTVYDCIDLDTGELMAIKEIRFPDVNSVVETNQQVKEELDVIQYLQHSNIVEYYGLEYHKDHVHILMEYCSGGSLENLIRNEPITEVSIIKQISVQILEGLRYLHSKDIIHRDIKPDNILIDSKGVVKLVDFGAAKIVKSKKTVNGANTLIGTPAYMAPEIIIGDEVTTKVDIWSFGCTVLEMATGKRPWSNLENEWAIMYNLGISNQRPSIPENSVLGVDGVKEIHGAKKTLYVDFNIAFYEACRAFPEYHKSYQLKKFLHGKIKELMDLKCDQINIFTDGVPPATKIETQILRRKNRMYYMLKGDLGTAFREEYNLNVFNDRCENHIQDICKNYGIRFNGMQFADEGESKIIEMIKSAPQDDHHIIHTPDISDLTLSIISLNKPNCHVIDTEKMYYFSFNNFSHFIANTLPKQNLSASLRDFGFISIFKGNDYLPPVSNFNIQATWESYVDYINSDSGDNLVSPNSLGIKTKILNNIFKTTRSSGTFTASETEKYLANALLCNVLRTRSYINYDVKKQFSSPVFMNFANLKEEITIKPESFERKIPPLEIDMMPFLLLPKRNVDLLILSNRADKIKSKIDWEEFESKSINEKITLLADNYSNMKINTQSS